MDLPKWRRWLKQFRSVLGVLVQVAGLLYKLAVVLKDFFGF
jgi:hypothetical protein